MITPTGYKIKPFRTVLLWEKLKTVPVLKNFCSEEFFFFPKNNPIFPKQALLKTTLRSRVCKKLAIQKLSMAACTNYLKKQIS